MLAGREGPGFRSLDEAGHGGLVLVVFVLHGLGEADEVVAVRAVGEFGFNIALAAAQENGADAFAESCEVFVACRAAALVEFVVFAVETEERAEKCRVEEVDEGAEFIDTVFDGCAGENEGVAALEAFNGLGGLGGPIFNTLGFVEDDDIRPQVGIDLERVRNDLLVVCDGEKGRCGVAIKRGAGGTATKDEAQREGGEFTDLLLPFRFEGCRCDDEDATGLAKRVEKCTGGDGLDGLAEAHFIGEEGSLSEGKVEHAFALVGKERMECDVLGMAAVADTDLVVAAGEDAITLAGAVGEPGPRILRDAQPMGGVFEELFVEGFGIEVGDLEPFGIKEAADAGGELVEIALDPESVGFGVGDKVYAWGREALRGGECGALAAGKLEKEGFDVLAGAKAIDTEIRAGAGKLRGGDVADFGAIGHPAGGMNCEV